MQITSQIHALQVPFTIPIAPDRQIPRVVFVYILLGDREIWLVDSGVAGSEHRIGSYLQEIGRSLGEVSTLLLTHSHPDHIGAAAAIRNATDCRILIHEAERNWLEDVELQQRQRPVPGFDRLVGGSAQARGTIAGGERLSVQGGPTVECIETPGHSAGSVSFWIESERMLISGDAVIAPGDLPIYDDFRQCMASTRKLAAVEDVKFLLSSWDAPKRDEQVATRFQQGLEYLQRIEDAVQKTAGAQPQIDPMELCAQVVRRLDLPPVAVNPLVVRALMSHLDASKHQVSS